MESREPHDVRLVYLACAWLVAHRGHFLLDTSADAATDFHEVYKDFCNYLKYEATGVLPWDEDVQAKALLDILTDPIGIKRKYDRFKVEVYHGKKPSKEADEAFPYSRDAIVTLLCGGEVKLNDLFCTTKYSNDGKDDKIKFGMDEEKLDEQLSKLDEGNELILNLRDLYDCALLQRTLNCSFISEAKVEVYEQHKRDLEYLKPLVHKYAPNKYTLIFREEGKNNYVAYSGKKVKKIKENREDKKDKHATKDDFSEFLLKELKELPVETCDREAYEAMLERLRQRTFLPKQRDSDNRVIPQQLYYAELDRLLNSASAYLPMLSQTDEDGISIADKIRSIFRFRVSYYVGPLNCMSEHAWLARKKGKIYPWNFEKMVDLDKTEDEFIRRMTNTCTYLPGEEVLPVHSLLYSRYMVLDEINNLTVNGSSIPVPVKQRLVTELFEQHSRVTRKDIRDFLHKNGYLEAADELGGIDVTIKSSLRSLHSFSRMLKGSILTETQVEEIIRHAAYSEDKGRMERWLAREYPTLSKDDRDYIIRLKLKGFGRLSEQFLKDVYHTDPETGEMRSIIEMLWETNENLMQLLSDRYTFREQIEKLAADYYSSHPQTLSERLDDMYISNAVKRPILRTLKITEEVVKVMGRAPERIFVEMARDSGDDKGGKGKKGGKRTKSRREQLLELYAKIKTEEARELEAELRAMGDMTDNRLQSDRLFLYYTQLGRCMYTEEPIELSKLSTKLYDIDHIYPRSKVQDDSVLNNKVLCLSSFNVSTKKDSYPIDAATREKMRPWWNELRKNNLIGVEKYKRLTRATGFTDDELHEFINRQLVETRQSTKAVAQLLKERYPETEIVYVKAGHVSRFRQAFELFKSRTVNDLHHAKDAYLNIAVGNVYHERFTRRWFDVHQEYSLKTKVLFGHPVEHGGKTIWRGGADIAAVKKTMEKNAVHLTRYAFCRKGGLFDEQPVKAKSGLVPRKANLPTENYGGYNKTTASFYLLASYTLKREKDVIFVPIELMYAERVMKDEAFAAAYISNVISGINGGKPVTDVKLLLGGRKIKINTVIEADGMRMVLKGKSDKGAKIIIAPCIPLILGAQMERYVKRLESFAQKRKDGANIRPDAEHDHITAEENLALYDQLCDKLTDSVFAKCPGSIAKTVTDGREKFSKLTMEAQISCLLNILSWFGNVPNCNLESIGGSKKTGSKVPSAKLSNWKKTYTDVRIIDVSASGLYQSRSENLLTLL